MAGGHFELLRKALKHGPFRLSLEIHDGLGEVAWFVECCHADANVDHEFFINWPRRHEETLPSLNSDGECQRLPAG